MSNHFHLVVETPRANLVEGMRWFLAVYTNRFNHRHKESGHVFSGRYKALLVEGSAMATSNQTTMTLDWIAHQLHMGSAGHLSHLLYRKTPSTAQCLEEAIQNKLF